MTPEEAIEYEKAAMESLQLTAKSAPYSEATNAAKALLEHLRATGVLNDNAGDAGDEKPAE